MEKGERKRINEEINEDVENNDGKLLKFSLTTFSANELLWLACFKIKKGMKGEVGGKGKKAPENTYFSLHSHHVIHLTIQSVVKSTSMVSRA